MIYLTSKLPDPHCNVIAEVLCLQCCALGLRIQLVWWSSLPPTSRVTVDVIAVPSAVVVGTELGLERR
jgi:hypothetical protein